jgi:hypothetical protein
MQIGVGLDYLTGSGKSRDNAPKTKIEVLFLYSPCHLLQIDVLFTVSDMTRIDDLMTSRTFSGNVMHFQVEC